MQQIQTPLEVIERSMEREAAEEIKKRMPETTTQNETQNHVIITIRSDLFDDRKAETLNKACSNHGCGWFLCDYRRNAIEIAIIAQTSEALKIRDGF
jgi:predicted RNA-binding Zn ribbon-like protein